MITFTIRRLFEFIPTIIVAITIIFIILSILPGDAAFLRAAGLKRGVSSEQAIRQLREKWGLDDPIYVRYFRYLGELFTGNLGRSFRNDRKMTNVMQDRLPVTCILAVFSVIIAVVVGFTLGLIAAFFRGTIFDLTSMSVAVTAISIPEFWFGMVLMLLVAVKWGILPTSGYEAGNLKYFILPAVALGFRYIGLIARITRSSVLDVINKDYVRTARSKGLQEWKMRAKHIIRNALLPISTIVGLESGWLLANTVVIEEVFGLPGVGRLLVISVIRRDIPAMQASILVVVGAFLVLNLSVDLFYGIVDPRIRYD